MTRLNGRTFRLRGFSASEHGGQSPMSSMVAARAHERAWYFLVSALAIHVADEALTDFLSFYNPLVLRIR